MAQIRPYSHEVSALIYGLTTGQTEGNKINTEFTFLQYSVRWFFSVAKDPAVQLELVKTSCQAVFDENQQRAR